MYQLPYLVSISAMQFLAMQSLATASQPNQLNQPDQQRIAVFKCRLTGCVITQSFLLSSVNSSSCTTFTTSPEHFSDELKSSVARQECCISPPRSYHRGSRTPGASFASCSAAIPSNGGAGLSRIPSRCMCLVRAARSIQSHSYEHCTLSESNTARRPCSLSRILVIASSRARSIASSSISYLPMNPQIEKIRKQYRTLASERATRNRICRSMSAADTRPPAQTSAGAETPRR